MQALIKRRPLPDQPWYQGLELVERPEPQLTKPDEVKIKVLAAAICGTDLSIYKGTAALRDSLAALQTPAVIVGHEFCGQLVSLGTQAKEQIVSLLYQRPFLNQAVKDFLTSQTPATLVNHPALESFLKENFYISAEMHIVCGQCYQCRLGEGHVCQHTYIKGLHQDGVFAEYVVVPVQNLRLFAKGEISPEVIAFMDAIGNATHTVQTAEVMGRNILILGAGIQGLLAVAVAKQLGAGKIFITDASNPETGLTEDKLEKTKFVLAKKLGANFCLDTGLPDGRAKLKKLILAETGGTGVDAVLEMSGSYRALEDGFSNVRMGGTLALLGLPSGTLAVDFSKEIIFKGLTIKGVIGRKIFATWDLMYQLLTQGLEEVILKNQLITHDLPLVRFEEGFAALKSGEALKVILRPT